MFKRWALLIFLGLTAVAQAAPNPVAPGIADAGLIRFNGQYYLMGVGTDGAFYVSRDLVRWQGPHPAFSMDNAWATGPAGANSEIHACDIVLHEGRFHLYWAVNYRALRAIGSAVSNTIGGPYQEPQGERPFDGRIDPQLFVDDDGACYFYTTKFAFGNVIYGQTMDGPSTLTGEARRLLSALPNTWEWRDHPVNEASFVRRYRDRYYMLYNANHTSAAYGNYAIGCAVADAPLAFSNETKYPFHLLRDNWENIHANAEVLSPLSLDEGVQWKYTDGEPTPDWLMPAYDDSDWPLAPGSFGNTEQIMFGGDIRTHWQTDTIRMRRNFDSDQTALDGELYVLINHDADASVYLNGVAACTVTGFSRGYTLKPVSEEATRTLRKGENLLAVRCDHNTAGVQYIDAGLYLFKPGTAEMPIYNCGQPNLVRGPNGFEWWLVYFAKYGGAPMRGQGIERVHFFDRELYIEGPTSPETPGRYRAPARPGFVDYFDDTDLSEQWRAGSGEWRVEHNELVQKDGIGLHRMNLRLPVHTHYLFESGLRFLNAKGNQVGIIAWERGPEQALYIGLDRKENTWFWVHRHEFVVRTEVFNMPETFYWDGPITIRLLKNGPAFSLFINDIPAPGGGKIYITGAEAGRPGLVTRDSAAAFAGIQFTPGWDEYDEHIRAWGAAADGAPETGVWGGGTQGLIVEPGSGEGRTFKGDLLEDFEWSVHVMPDTTLSDAEFGAYPWYRDQKNYMRVTLDAEMSTITATGKVKGEALAPRTAALTLRERRLYPAARAGISLRFLRVGSRLTIFVDGRETLDMVGDWPPAQVGLFALHAPCRFNGITLFALNKDDRDS